MMYKLTFLIGDAIADALAAPFKALGEAIRDKIISGLKYFFGLLFYLICSAVLKLANLFYAFFKVFSGISTVTYDGESKYLINVFFDNTSINKVYWSFAVLGFVLMLVFAFIAVIRKLFDSSDKNRASYGQILTSCGKSMLIILLMTFGMNVALSATNMLMQRINFIFNRANATTEPGKRYFTGEEIAKMNNILEKIGNYAINPSYSSRYSVNSCYNSIREDMLELQKAGVFEYEYDDDCWQGVLKRIAKASDLRKDVMMDVYHDSISTSMLAAMNKLQSTSEFRPAQYAVGSGLGSTEDVPIDVIIFLSGTATAAKNDFYNNNVSVTDALRGPYYTGRKSIYDFSSVSDDFEISIGGIDYFVIAAVGVLVIWQLITCVLTCAVRIFNMLLLYVIAPPFAATIPLDDGQRFKSWVDAMVVQCLNVFGTVIVMRLAMLYIPIVMSDKLVLFDNGFMDIVGKAILIYAGFVAAARGADLFGGILTGNGAGASMQTGNMQAQGLTASRALKGLAEDATGVTKVKDKTQKAYKSMVSKGGVAGAAVTDIGRKRMESRAQKAANAQPDKPNENKTGGSAAGKPGAGGGSAGEAKNANAAEAENKEAKNAAASGEAGAPAPGGDGAPAPGGDGAPASVNASVSANGGAKKKKTAPKKETSNQSSAPKINMNDMPAPAADGTQDTSGEYDRDETPKSSADITNELLQKMNEQMTQMNQQMKDANAANPEDAIYKGYEVEEVQSTGLGSALGIHNTMLSSTNKRPDRKQKKEPKKSPAPSESKKAAPPPMPETHMHENEEEDKEDK